MQNAIKNFNKQFKFRSKVEGGKVKRYKTYIVCGMGGSHLSANILQTAMPGLDIIIHSDYGLPTLSENRLKKALVIASSYSGNTEETISAYEEARAKNLPLVAIAVGGKLIEMAKKDNVPYIILPGGIQPRSALGYSIKALMKAMKLNDGLKEIALLAKSLEPGAYEQVGKELANRLRGKFPIIYSSTKNYSVAYNWKIKFNETGKIPAFCNVVPELNHNEMTGFDVKNATKKLSENLYFIILKDQNDNPKIIKRMDVLEKLYKDRGLSVEFVELKGENEFQKIFSSLVLADWAALYTAEAYGLESEQVPMVEEFKNLVVRG